MKIIGIDIGLIHLAIVAIELPENYLQREEIIEESEIYFCELIDITELITECDKKECDLYHDKIICDYMTHLFRKYDRLFKEADKIFIERQPPTGFVAIQEIIMMQYRNKSTLISPNAMLNHFGILQYDYEERKVHTERIASEYLGGIKVFVFNERRHDMADAFCLLYYYLDKKRKHNREEEEKHIFRENNQKYISTISKFKYPSVSTSLSL